VTMSILRGGSYPALLGHKEPGAALRGLISDVACGLYARVAVRANIYDLSVARVGRTSTPRLQRTSAGKAGGAHDPPSRRSLSASSFQAASRSTLRHQLAVSPRGSSLRAVSSMNALSASRNGIRTSAVNLSSCLFMGESIPQERLAQ